jgi:hypothetical protein
MSSDMPLLLNAARAVLVIAVYIILEFGAGCAFVDAIAQSKSGRVNFRVPCLIGGIALLIATSAFRLMAEAGDPNSLYEGVRWCLIAIFYFALGVTCKAFMGLHQERKAVMKQAGDSSPTYTG